MATDLLWPLPVELKPFLTKDQCLLLPKRKAIHHIACNPDLFPHGGHGLFRHHHYTPGYILESEVPDHKQRETLCHRS